MREGNWWADVDGEWRGEESVRRKEGRVSNHVIANTMAIMYLSRNSFPCNRRHSDTCTS